MYKRKSQRQTAGTRCTIGSPRDRQQGHDVRKEVPETAGTRCTRGSLRDRHQGHNVQEEVLETDNKDSFRWAETVSMQPETERGFPCTQPAVLVLSRTRQCAGRSGSSDCRHASCLAPDTQHSSTIVCSLMPVLPPPHIPFTTHHNHLLFLRLSLSLSLSLSLLSLIHI